MKPRVFVVQNAHRSKDGELVPKYDISPAAAYGELIELLSPSAKPFTPRPIIAELREKLHDYGDDDYLLLIGNPALISFAVAIAADFNDGRVRLLQWSKITQGYVPIAAELFEIEPQ